MEGGGGKGGGGLIETLQIRFWMLRFSLLFFKENALNFFSCEATSTDYFVRPSVAFDSWLLRVFV